MGSGTLAAGKRLLRICNPVPFRVAGGGFYFLRSLEQFLTARGHTLTHDISAHYDILLINSWQVDYDDVLAGIRVNPRLRIVHRVDGSSQDYGRDPKGDRRQRDVNRFADLTIFQSAYCRHSTREKFPVIRQDGPVIYNAVDLQRFSPEGPRVALPGQEPRLIYVTYSTNPMKGWGDVYHLAHQHPGLTFILVGRYEDPPDLPNLQVVGEIDHDQLPAVLRAADVFLAFQRHEACPNVVLEAMAVGLPVLYVESGATPELVGPCGLPVTVETFAATLEQLLAQRRLFSECARQDAEVRFAPDVVFSAYEEHMQRLSSLPMGWREARRWLWAWGAPAGRRLRRLVRRR